MLMANVAVLVVWVSLASASLPDNRSYELVSPPAKNGADIVPHSPKTFAAANGNGVAYVGLGAFGDVKGTATDVQYVARRSGVASTNGWASTAVNPSGGAPSLLALFFVNWPSFQTFTPDLHDGIYKSWKPLTDAPNVAGVSNLYRLHDVEASQSATELLSASAAPLNPSPTADSSGILWQSRFVGASSDLRHVILQSPWNLTGDGSFSTDGDLYEQVQSVGMRRVGRIPSGTSTECDDNVPGSECIDAPPVQAGLSVPLLTGSSQYSTGMISDDGSRILFQGPAGAPTGPIYMREDGTRTFQIDASEKSTPESPGNAQLWGMSTDGSRIFFTTNEGLLDSDNDGGNVDLYLYDRTAPARSRLRLLSQDSTADPAVFVTGVVGASTDAHYVYFLSIGQLVSGEASGVFHGLYVWHDGQIRYIGRFDDFNLAGLNTPATSWDLLTFTRTSRVSADGRHLLFMSTNDDGFRDQGGYRGYDHGTCGSSGCRELYLYSFDSGRLACVSCNPLRSAATGDALIDVSPGVSASPPTEHGSHALSDDGQHVFFSTVEGLVPEDSNAKWDAYEYDTASGSVHLISTGTSSSDSYFMDASPDGHDAFFVTRQRLLGWDIDDNYDLYDARINGGFPEPPSTPQPCATEGCRPPATIAPTTTPATSAHFRGAGNSTGKLKKHHRKCKTPTVPKRVRGKRKCVHPTPPKHHKRTHAHNNRSTR
jgi:hypothetical protein